MHNAIRFMTLACLSAPLFLAAQTSNVTLPQDKGPNKIDISSYPAEQQKSYKMFTDKCSKCHDAQAELGNQRQPGEGDLRIPRLRPGIAKGQEPIGILEVPV